MQTFPGSNRQGPQSVRQFPAARRYRATIGGGGRGDPSELPHAQVYQGKGSRHGMIRLRRSVIPWPESLRFFFVARQPFSGGFAQDVCSAPIAGGTLTWMSVPSTRTS